MRYFAELPDPRADGWDDYADFVLVEAKWFKTSLDRPHGAPSADTCRRVFTRLDPQAFERSLRRWGAGGGELRRRGPASNMGCL
jgi:hypothetical protein